MRNIEFDAKMSFESIEIWLSLPKLLDMFSIGREYSERVIEERNPTVWGWERGHARVKNELGWVEVK